MEKRSKVITAKIEPTLQLHIEDQSDFDGMSNYVRRALKKVSKYKPKKS